MVLLALFGATMGQGVIWYTGQFYAQSFLENTCKLDFNDSRYILLIAIVIATPFFVIFGSWSDKVGRKWIMMIGMLLGVLFYRPIYKTFVDKTNYAEFQKTELKVESVPKVVKGLAINGKDSLVTTTVEKMLKDGSTFKEVTSETNFKDKSNTSEVVVTQIDKTLSSSTFWLFVALVSFQIILVTMVYGPIAAFLVELFPTKIRYTSMSLPYHIGNGVFGGLVPFIATLIASFQGSDELSGLWYPIGIAAFSFIIGSIYLSNKKGASVED